MGGVPAEQWPNCCLERRDCCWWPCQWKEFGYYFRRCRRRQDLPLDRPGQATGYGRAEQGATGPQEVELRQEKPSLTLCIFSLWQKRKIPRSGSLKYDLPPRRSDQAWCFMPFS